MYYITTQLYLFYIPTIYSLIRYIYKMLLSSLKYIFYFKPKRYHLLKSYIVK